MQQIRTARKHYDLASVILLLCVLIVGFGSAGAPRIARAAVPAAAASLTVAPSTAEAGKDVVIAGTGFPPNESIQLAISRVDTAGAAIGFGVLTTVRASATGTFQYTRTIPAYSPAGAYLVRAYAYPSKLTVYAHLNVVAPKATITITPSSVSPGSVVTVTGSGFAPNEAVTISISTPAGTAATPLGQARANATGAFVAPGLHVPFGIAPGRQLIVATGQTSNRQATTAVTVAVQAPTLSVSPTIAKPGEALAVQGAHFQPGEAITIDLVTLSGNVRLGTATANASGAFAASGLVVPANTPEGTVTIVATGSASHLSATYQIKVTTLATNLSLSRTTAVAGETITVAGHGFIPGETISLQIASATVRVPLGVVVANTQGAFSVPNVVVPAFLTAGTYTVIASGQTSGRTASSRLVVTVRHAAAPSLSITGATPVAGVFQANPGALLQVAGSGFPAGASVSLVLAGARSVSLLTARVDSKGVIGPLGVTIPATTPPGSYKLEALVGGHLLAATAVIRIAPLAPHILLSTSTLLPGTTEAVHGSGFAAGEQVVIALNGAALLTKPGTIITNASGQFLAYFTVPQSVNNGANVLIATGISSRASATVTVTATLSVASRWYFVNGDTTNGRTTTISILNPNNAIATVKMTFLYQAASEQHYTQVVPAHTVSLVDLGLVAGSGRIISTILEADRQISAESIVNYPGADNTIAIGAAGAATRWYLAEGYTNGSFSETIHVMNPNSTYATVDVQFLPFNNKPARETRFVMLPDSNIQIDAGQYMPGLSISAIVSADKPIVVERSMHFGLHGRGAHDKIGTTTLSTVWLFAQGQSAGDRQTFFTILNPNQAAQAAVTATFFNTAGQPIGARTIVVDPLHRGNIKLNDVLPNAQVATVITSNVPVVVERPFYIGPPQLGLAPSGSVVFGRNGGGLSWSFPGGSTLGGDQTMMYLFNPGVQPIQVKATFYTDSGAVVTQTLTLTPDSDLTVNAASVPGMPAARFGAILQSTNGQPFVAEESVQNDAAQTYDGTQGVAQ
ncbi:MAG TPA: hypothetical protein VHB98_10880 [Chloroflexota bacterium]|nr:hypothetical protein [Chloroflexota bacterium]